MTAHPMSGTDYIEANRSGVVHASQVFASTAFCGAALVGQLRPRKSVHLNCPKCKELAR